MGDATELHEPWKATEQTMTAEPLPFDAFFEDESDRLFRVLCVIIGSRSQAEDIAQEAFIKVLERWDLVSRMENPRAYLDRTAMNLFRSESRRATRALKRLVTFTPEPDDVFAPVEDRDQAARALALLTARQRAALVLTEALGYSGEETAQLLGIKASTVYALTYQARSALAEVEELR
jgi:RNA polymerase sigma-70 factor (ECF subfamily)